jgi:hypothetical protein
MRWENYPPICRVTLVRSISFHTGAINVGLLFCTLPAALLTFHTCISSAENGLSNSTGGCDGSAGALDCLLEDVIKETLGRVAGSPFRTERRPLLDLSQGRKQCAV